MSEHKPNDNKPNDYDYEISAVVLDVVTWERSPEHISGRIAEVAMNFGKSMVEVAIEVDAAVKEYRIKEYQKREES